MSSVSDGRPPEEDPLLLAPDEDPLLADAGVVLDWAGELEVFAGAAAVDDELAGGLALDDELAPLELLLEPPHAASASTTAATDTAAITDLSFLQLADVIKRTSRVLRCSVSRLAASRPCYARQHQSDAADAAALRS